MERRTIALFCTMAFTFWLFALCVHSSNMQVTAANASSDAAQQGQRTPPSEKPVLLSTLAQGMAVDAPVNQIALPEMPTLSLACSAAILVEQSTGTVLYEFHPDEQRAVASITKVMTLLLTFEAIQEGEIALSDVVPISDHAFSMGGSQIWLEPGEVFTLEELIKAVCVSSANDAAVAIAEYVGGSEEAFVSRMNARAAELGLANTTYQNACGLDQENHLSSARDVAVLSCYILTHCPEVLNYTGIWTDTLRDGATALTNTNKLLNYYDGITGLKTGTTGDAGICISASATRDGLSLIAVVLGSASSTDRFHSAIAMLDYGFATFEAAVVPPCADAPATQFVKGGEVEALPLDYGAVPTTLLLEKGDGSALRTEVVLEEDTVAPVGQGAVLGEMRVYQEDTLLAQYPITAAQTIEKLTVKGAMRALWLNLCAK